MFWHIRTVKVVDPLFAIIPRGSLRWLVASGHVLLACKLTCPKQFMQARVVPSVRILCSLRRLVIHREFRFVQNRLFCVVWYCCSLSLLILFDSLIHILIVDRWFTLGSHFVQGYQPDLMLFYSHLQTQLPVCLLCQALHTTLRLHVLQIILFLLILRATTTVSHFCHE